MLHLKSHRYDGVAGSLTDPALNCANERYTSDHKTPVRQILLPSIDLVFLHYYFVSEKKNPIRDNTLEVLFCLLLSNYVLFKKKINI